MTMPSVRVLAIDGGGVRGILPSRVLAALEEMTGRPTAELFDLAVGTSIGGIGVLSLARPGPDGRPACSGSSGCCTGFSRADHYPGQCSV